MTEENKVDESKKPNFSASKLRTLGTDANKFNRIAVGGKSLANDVVITKDWLQSFSPVSYTHLTLPTTIGV